MNVTLPVRHPPTPLSPAPPPRSTAFKLSCTALTHTHTHNGYYLAPPGEIDNWYGGQYNFSDYVLLLGNRWTSIGLKSMIIVHSFPNVIDFDRPVSPPLSPSLHIFLHRKWKWSTVSDRTVPYLYINRLLFSEEFIPVGLYPSSHWCDYKISIHLKKHIVSRKWSTLFNTTWWLYRALVFVNPHPELDNLYCKGWGSVHQSSMYGLTIIVMATTVGLTF